MCYSWLCAIPGCAVDDISYRVPYMALRTLRARAKNQEPRTKMPYTFRQGDLPKLDLQVDRGTDFKAWKTQWEAYLSLSGLGTQDQATQVQVCFSREKQ